MEYKELSEKEKNVYSLIINKGIVDYNLNKSEILRILSVLIDFLCCYEVDK